MKQPLFQILKDDEAGTVGAAMADGLSEEDAVAMVLAFMEAARANEALDNMIRIVANSRRHEAPNKEVDNVDLFMDVNVKEYRKKKNLS